MIDIEQEAINMANRWIQKEEDASILSMINHVAMEMEMNQIDQEHPLKTIYVGVLKYGWNISLSDGRDNTYRVDIWKDPKYSLHVYLSPGEYE